MTHREYIHLAKYYGVWNSALPCTSGQVVQGNKCLNCGYDGQRYEKVDVANPWTFESEQGESYTHCTIRFFGRVQPFGAVFFGSRSDIKRLVRRAVAKLNKAWQDGKTEVCVQGMRRGYRVVWISANIFTNEQVRIFP